MKWFKKLRYTNVMESVQKVQRKLNDLNKGITSRPWVAVPGFNVMTTITFNAGGISPTFDANTGYPVKVFVNNLTGEVKTYSAYAFMD